MDVAQKGAKMMKGSAHPQADGFVGVFDSGVGGISVLRHLVHELPHEDFHFFGDSANNPYGGKTAEEVCALSLDIAERMVSDGAKALVIACNTATSSAAPLLRETFSDMPVVGVEPALKPAVLAEGDGKVLVLATEVTLKLDKFHRLAERWAGDTEVTTVACKGLANRIERGNLDAPDLHELLEELIGAYRGEVDRVVLGCTHYPFVRKQIAEVLGDVRFFDGGAGTARQLRRLLEQGGLLRSTEAPGEVVLASSIDTPEQLELYHWFYDVPGEL